LYENWFLTVLNTLFTPLCVIVLGTFEQGLKSDTQLTVPELYIYGQRNKGLNRAKYLVWLALATVEGMLVWFLAFLLTLATLIVIEVALKIARRSLAIAGMWPL
jgi:phospholipid-translocating ATPase